jgi:2-polyprenyl-3-methyl-5-hydroxy-6-metoxy-1,4-benzoquinol methylase
MRPLPKLINRFANVYLRYVCRLEYRCQKYLSFNERPVEYSFVFRQLAQCCPRAVLDVGTGSTALPQLMHHCGFLVTAIDNIKDFWPKGMVNRHFYVINDDITSTKLTGKFDMITCVSVLEHIREYDRAVASMVSLLRSGGHLVFSFPYNEKAYVQNVYHLNGSNAARNLPFEAHAFSRNELERWVRDHAAELIEQEYWRFFSGEYWSVGERLRFPEKVNKAESHQMTCVLLRKG